MTNTGQIAEPGSDDEGDCSVHEIRRSPDRRWQLWDDEFVVEWDRTHGRLYLGENASSRMPRALMSSILALGQLGSAMALHAGVIADHGRGALLVGPSGSGNSSTVAIGHHAGFQIGSDDTAFVRRAGGRFEVRGFPRAPMVPAELHPNRMAGKPDRRGRLPLDSENLVEDWLPLDRLIFIRHGTDARSEISHVGGREAARLLISRTSVKFFESNEHRRVAMQMLVDLTTNPLHVLTLGADPTQRLQTTSEALRSMFSKADY